MRAFKKITFVLGILCILSLVIVLLAGRLGTIIQGVEAQSHGYARSGESPFDPAKFGVPDQLAGYRVLAVLNETNYACLRTGEKHLVLLSSEANLHDYLSSSDPNSIKQALHAANLDEYASWGWDIVGPGTTQEQLIQQLELSNNLNKSNGCPVPLGGVPTPSK